jgi:hypothetical protein
MDTTFIFSTMDWLMANPLHALLGLMALLLAVLTFLLLRVTGRSLAAMEMVSEGQRLEPGHAYVAPVGQGNAGVGIPETARVRSTPGRALRHSVSELLDIEESLLGLRELYWRKLIPLEVYARESLKVGSRLKG